MTSARRKFIRRTVQMACWQKLSLSFHPKSRSEGLRSFSGVPTDRIHRRGRPNVCREVSDSLLVDSHCGDLPRFPVGTKSRRGLRALSANRDGLNPHSQQTAPGVLTGRGSKTYLRCTREQSCRQDRLDDRSGEFRTG